MKVLNKADVFLINGAGMESYLTRVMDTFPKLPWWMRPPASRC